MTTRPLPVDAVITWVDGADPAHAARRAAALSEAPTQPHAEGTGATRFHDAGELFWAIASLLRYAPFVRRIWIVTDAQRPPGIEGFAQAGLCAPDRIQVVDHLDFFGSYLDVLPTFNSLTIESMLWAIEGLAEHFIVMNDDYFLNAPATTESFFDAEGRPVLRGKWVRSGMRQRIRAALLGIAAPNRTPAPSFGKAQAHAARLAGTPDRYLREAHAPHPLRRSTLRRFYAANEDALRAQISHRFRHHTQHYPMTLANMLELAAEPDCYAGASDVVYVKADKIAPDDGALAQIAEGSRAFGCIQSLDQATPQASAALIRFLDTKFADHLPPR